MEIQVDDQSGERLDAYLAGRLAELSRSRVQTLIREQFILVNGHPAKPRDAVNAGDRITIEVGIEKIGTTSVSFIFNIKKADGTPAGSAKTVSVTVNRNTFLKEPIPPDWRAKLERSLQ